MQRNFYHLLIRLLVYKVELPHLVILMAGLFFLNRFQLLIEHCMLPSQHDISLIGSVNAASKSEKTTDQGPLPDNSASPALQEKKEGIPEIDPLTLDENQIKILNALAAKEERLPEKFPEAELKKKEELLKLAKAALEKDFQQLKEQKNEFQEQKQELTKEEKQNVENTAKIYEGIKPSPSAEILNKLELSAAVEIIKHMNKKKAAAVLAAMDAQKARQITLAMLRTTPKHDDTAN